MIQENQRQDVNGSSNKPYPTERNFVIDAMATIPNKMTDPIVTQDELGNVQNQFGQIKYAKREGAKSIYKDVSRQTANDRIASAKAEGSTVYGVEIDQSDKTDGDQD